MSGKKTSYRLDDQVGFLLRLAYQRHISIFGAQTPGDITPVQFSILYRLMESRKPVSQNALGRLIGMDAATTKGVVSRLITRGLIGKTEDEEDRRRYSLSITDAGREIMQSYVPRMRDVSEATLSPLSSADREVLIELLKRLT